MKEFVLCNFFAGNITASELARDLEGSVRQVSDIGSVIRIEDMTETFSVTRPMLIKVCDSILADDLPIGCLSTIGFALQASDKFEWDDKLMNEVLADWSSPEINYPLTLENVRHWKEWLEERAPYPQRSEKPMPSDGRVVRRVEKESVDS